METNLTSPELQSTFAGTPSGFEMSKTCSIKATVIQTLSSAKNLPGQILRSGSMSATAVTILPGHAPPAKAECDACRIGFTARCSGASLVSLWDEVVRVLVHPLIVEHGAAQSCSEYIHSTKARDPKHAQQVCDDCCSLGYEHPPICVVFGRGVRDTWKRRACITGAGRSQYYTPRGATAFQRNVSFTMLAMYGRRSRSSKVGRRSLPTASSSSFCARRCTWGYRVIARTKLRSAATV